MLELKSITKNYYVGDMTVEALKGVSLGFRESEFVSILGPSGCGKTTLLNIIGGLDRYTAGDIVINGVSTKLYNDGDWDAYRNHSIGFVFQNYNLIPHQTVLANVELALTLSGIAPAERKERALKALERVGLGDQAKKLPAQLSGGQMQRVAIARALVNDPNIILADEPTGALDTETSVQVMNILKELSAEKLVIMVTHNPELADQYSTRIIRLKDGEIREDTDPYECTACEKENAKKMQRESGRKRKKPSMSLLTALSLSLKNLGTKKARTILTSFAGSIGIIGISLILSLSSGFSGYINTVQRDTLSNYPVTITRSAMDMTGFATSFLGSSLSQPGEIYPDDEKITPNKMIGGMLTSISQTMGSNDLSAFKSYLDQNPTLLDKSKISAVSYSYNFDINLYQKEEVGYRHINKIGPLSDYMPEDLPPTLEAMFNSVYPQFKNMMEGSGTWGELIGSNELIEAQYDLLAGDWPTQSKVAEGESWPLLLVVDDYNRIPDYSLYMMGLINDKEVRYMFTEMMYAMYDKMNGTNNTEALLKEQFGDFRPYMNDITFEMLVGREYNLLLDGEYFEKSSTKDMGDGKTVDLFSQRWDGSEFVNNALTNSVKLKVCGIVRKKEGVAAGALGRYIYYTPALTDYLIDRTQDIPVVKEQKRVQNFYEDQTASYSVNVLTGVLEPNNSDTLASAFRAIGMVDKSNPTGISIYPTSFENKDYVINLINEYNASQSSEGTKIQYTDYIGMMMSSITTIIDAITYVLIAFVSISLVVSSIMIGVITYISVLERTKEIGILRSIGASKRDIGRVFNAETMIIGFISGALGILITVILNVPISILIEHLAGIPSVAALPVLGGVILIVISVVLTLIAGLIPSGLAAKKDPVIALRSE